MEWFKSIVTFLNDNEGALMVIITFVYVIATCFICWANLRSAKASKDQLAEMKREHEETIRYGIMPFLQMEDTAESGYSFMMDLPLADQSEVDWEPGNIVRVKNIGNGAATNLTYTWIGSNMVTTMNDAFPVNAIKADGEYKIYISFPCVKTKLDGAIGTLTLHFDDMRGYSYNQRMTISYMLNSSYSGINEINADAPIYLNVMENA